MLGVGTQELDDLAVTVCGLPWLAARLIHHAEAIVSFVHFGIAHQKLARGGFGLIEFAFLYEIHDGIGVAGQFILVVAKVPAEVASLRVVVVLGRFGGAGRCRLG